MTRQTEVQSRLVTSRVTGEPLLSRWWLWPNLLGLDAPLVAVVWQALFARTVHVTLFPAARLALALAVWAVYLADRLLDCASSEASGATSGEAGRHVFCRYHARA